MGIIGIAPISCASQAASALIRSALAGYSVSCDEIAIKARVRPGGCREMRRSKKGQEVAGIFAKGHPSLPSITCPYRLNVRSCSQTVSSTSDRITSIPRCSCHCRWIIGSNVPASGPRRNFDPEFRAGHTLSAQQFPRCTRVESDDVQIPLLLWRLITPAEKGSPSSAEPRRRAGFCPAARKLVIAALSVARFNAYRTSTWSSGGLVVSSEYQIVRNAGELLKSFFLASVGARRGGISRGLIDCVKPER